ncbi:hypothetical protein D3C80_1559260 [compost metagenome]
MEVAVHVEVAVEQIQAAVLDKAIGFLLLTGYGQLRGGGGDRQGEKAGFHDVHGLLHRFYYSRSRSEEPLQNWRSRAGLAQGAASVSHWRRGLARG